MELAYDERRGTNLVETMEAWFAAGSRPAETAKTLHIHPNTVAQRLDRVSRLLGPRVARPLAGPRPADGPAALPAAA